MIEIHLYKNIPIQYTFYIEEIYAWPKIFATSMTYAKHIDNLLARFIGHTKSIFLFRYFSYINNSKN